MFSLLDAKKIIAVFTVLCFLILSSIDAFAFTHVSVGQWQNIPHGQARFFQLSDNENSTSDQGNRYGLEITLEPQWHTYWVNPGDSGAPPEIIAIKDNKKAKGNTETLLDIQYPFPERMDVGPLTTYGYSEHTAYFFSTPSQALAVRADILVCKEECIPGSVEINWKAFNRLAAIKSPELHSFLKKQISKLPSTEGSVASKHAGARGVNWNLTLPKGAKLLDLFWYPENVNQLQKPQLIDRNNGSYSFYTANDFIVEKLRSSQAEGKAAIKALAVYEFEGALRSETLSFISKAPELLPFVLMAIVGGLILNLMPCVFPIVSLKAFSIASASGKALTQVRRDQIFYCLGVIACFVSLALFIAAVRASGQFIGWGFQLQNPWVVAGLSVLFIILGLSFFDVWQWNKIPGFAFFGVSGVQSGPFASFMTGLLAVVVASPCTAPFMGAAIGFALSQSTLIIFAVFIGLGLGMSLPFLLLALFPQMSQYLPRPGNWMVHFKKGMGILLLLTAVWLIWLGFQLIAPSKPIDDTKWQALDMSQWQDLRNIKEARFVNFTADWCVSCKVNEKVVFANSDVEGYFEENNIQLFKVDWTKKQNSIGEKLAEYGRAGVPLYLYYPQGADTPYTLPELLTPEMLINKLNGLSL